MQTHPWAHLAQPAGQQEQQLFLQEVHLHSLHVQEPAQVQESPVAQEQLGSMASRGGGWNLESADRSSWIAALGTLGTTH
ncbi:hypothetical protein PSU14_21340, partial [Yersinia pestis]|nr:hypothetical protein [Yersinia pestis]